MRSTPAATRTVRRALHRSCCVRCSGILPPDQAVLPRATA